jgi:hypothetical protein
MEDIGAGRPPNGAGLEEFPSSPKFVTFRSLTRDTA